MSVTDCQLLNACQSAYGIAPDGTFSQLQPYYNQVNWADEGPTPIVSGDFKSDAVVVGQVNGATVIAFRGTEQLKTPIEWGQIFDWLGNDFIGLPPMVFPGQASWGNVHTGWWDSVDALWNDLAQCPIDFSNPVYVTGHSKGGPMASLAAMRFLSEGRDVSNMKVVTFASPHPGDKAFAGQYAKVFPDAYGYANHLDVVPLVPFSREVIDAIKLFSSPTGLLLGLLDLMHAWGYHQAGKRAYYKKGVEQYHDSSGLLEPVALEAIKKAVENASSETKGLEQVASAHSLDCPSGDVGGYTEAACAPCYKGYCT